MCVDNNNNNNTHNLLSSEATTRRESALEGNVSLINVNLGINGERGWGQ